MTGFPQTPEYTGLNTPIGEEYDEAGLEVTGTIPPEVEGAFFRAVPDPAYPPFMEDGGAILSADGMISGIYFEGGKVRASARFVQTARHQAEVKAGHTLFGKYRNVFTDKPEVAGVDRTVSNTTPVWHAGKLLMTKEDGRPYRVDPNTLETLGSYDFGGKLRSQTMTAHVRIDPVTGEMFFYGYECAGLATAKIAYCVADRDGNLVSEQWFDPPYCAMMHDFTITENYALFPIYPTTADLDRIKAGGDHWVHEMDRDSWVGVVPRYGSVDEVRWFRGPKGVMSYHMMNAHEDAEGRILFDQCLADCNAFPFIQKASGYNISPQDMNGRLARWTIDLNDGSDTVTETVIGPPGDFPLIPAARQGRSFDHGWVLTMNPELRGPPVLGGPVGVMFNLMLRLDFTGRPPQAFALPPMMSFNEPVHVPSAAPGHDGWLVLVVDRQTGPDAFEHEVWILDGGDIAAGPVATVKLPRRTRPQVHGWWVGAAQLAAAA
ncbi:MAG: carotenoid oxygenase family protein [Sphingomonas sp.]